MADEGNDPEFDAFIADITPDVMGVLKGKGFFAKLETRIFPDGTVQSKLCDGTYAVCDSILAELNLDEDKREDVHDVMRSLGGFCDCEILLNAAAESPTGEAYWKQRAVEWEVE